MPRSTRHLLLTALGGLACFAGGASAAVVDTSSALPSQIAQPSPQRTPQQVRVTGSPIAPLAHDALRELPGRFQLADGRKLEVARHGLHLMVAVGRQWALPVEHLRGHRFATRDGRLAVEFLPAADGRVDALRLVEQRRLTLAGHMARD